jgi:transcriptional regulator with XRE-family HTH domain
MPLKNSDEWVVSQPLPPEIRAGELLRAARLHADMTQTELAERIKVPPSHISQYERNIRKIPQPKAKMLADILETSEEYFLG